MRIQIDAMVLRVRAIVLKASSWRVVQLQCARKRVPRRSGRRLTFGSNRDGLAHLANIAEP